MKKENKNTLITGLLVLVVGVGVYFAFFHEKTLPRPELSDPPKLVEPKNHKYSFDNPPVYKKEGEVRFTDGQNGELISRIDVEIADTEFDRALGLMFRPEMADTLGMLFLFEQERNQAFWMRNTIIPLDIIYVNSKGEIVKIYENTKTRSDKSLPSGKPAIYVVEVNGGYCDEHGIEAGDMVEF
ncbi:MAG: DUF192 domain-containing protein [Bacteroidota bacterium]|nr:DUF192 domain-containing protein [Bacteroidota bacterium]